MQMKEDLMLGETWIREAMKGSPNVLVPDILQRVRQ